MRICRHGITVLASIRLVGQLLYYAGLLSSRITNRVSEIRRGMGSVEGAGALLS